jgi:hypothetical protein
VTKVIASEERRVPPGPRRTAPPILHRAQAKVKTFGHGAGPRRLLPVPLLVKGYCFSKLARPATKVFSQTERMTMIRGW